MLTGIDHFVLTVSDREQSCAFYEALGLTRETFAAGRIALKVGGQKINLHLAEGEAAEPKAARPLPGSGDFCLLTDSLEEALRRIRGAGLEIVLGPVSRTGARGAITSVYLRDPDGNLVEVSEYDERRG